MKLTDLNPSFLHPTPDAAGWFRSGDLTGAQGIVFRCPRGGHEIVLWFEKPVAAAPAPEDQPPFARWGHSGTGLGDLTLHPSVDERGCWHGWVRNGEVTSC